MNHHILYVFGYGSLMNEKSLKKTLPEASLSQRVELKGYRRTFNKQGRNYRYLNIMPDSKKHIRGTLIQINEQELATLKERERGYNLIDVTNLITPKPAQSRVMTFVAPASRKMNLPISRHYLNIIKEALLPEEWEHLLNETDFCGAYIADDET